MKIRRLWIILALLGLLVAGGIAWTFLQPEPIEAVELKQEDVIATLTVTGEMEAEEMVNISPQVQARITEILVDEGDSVAQGQVVARLEADTPASQLREAQARAAQARASLQDVLEGTREEEIARLAAQVSESEAQLAQQQAALESARAQLAEATNEAQRFQSLRQGGFISVQEYEATATRRQVAQEEVSRLQGQIAAARSRIEQSRQALRQARNGATAAEIAQARAAQRAAQAATSTVRTQLEDYSLKSKVAGVVTEKLQDAGELGSPGQAILRVATLDDLKLVAAVEEGDLHQIHLNDEAIVVLDAFPEFPLPSVITRIGKEVNPENGTVEVEMHIKHIPPKPPANFRLLPGMTADANIVTNRLKEALVVPASAVQRINDRPVVYVFENNKLIERPVKLQRISVEYYRVLDGLKAGDWVAAAAKTDLVAKKRVQPIPMRAKSEAITPPKGF